MKLLVIYFLVWNVGIPFKMGEILINIMEILDIGQNNGINKNSGADKIKNWKSFCVGKF